MLTIIHTTVNRKKLLLACVKRLIPQLNGNQKIIIIDNASCVPVKETIENEIKNYEELNIQIIRNLVNIGGGANILRCLEVCETKWMYCLGDDDLVTKNCIETIEKVIKFNQDALYISFRRNNFLRSKTIRTDGLSEFIDELQDWGSFLFMSSSVLNAQRMRPHIRWGYLYSYSWAPFQAILFKMLNAGGVVIFAHEVICDEESRADETWVPFPVAAGKMILPELIDDINLRKRMANSLMGQPRYTTLIYLARAKATDLTSLANNALFLNLYFWRCAIYTGFLRFILQKMLASFVLNPILFPNLVFKIMQNLIFRLTGREKPIEKQMSHDRA